MVATNDTKFTWNNNVGSTHFKNTSMSSISTSKTATTTLSNKNPEPIKKRIESMTDEEIIQRNLKELMDKRNRVSSQQKLIY